MLWALAGGALFAAIIVAGRAHSRYLDRLDDQVSLSPMARVPHFESVCPDCAAAGIRSDAGDELPSATLIKCSACGALSDKGGPHHKARNSELSVG